MITITADDLAAMGLAFAGNAIRKGHSIIWKTAGGVFCSAMES